ncbi:MAG: cyclic pyranopterin monophosphate synthase MoaC [Chloroflexi bacterium]|nr:cyclic pyranopterin monophosphate synthase MoaC [Chloroflexota bacterium]
MVSFEIYTDGSYSWERHKGGWAAVIGQDGQRRYRWGAEEKGASSNRMELTAAIKALEETPPDSQVTIFSDSQYLIRSMQGRYRRMKNLDLWERLDKLAAERRVRWEWVQGHAGQKENEEADALADWASGLRKEEPPFLRPESEQVSVVAPKRESRMVDVGWKEPTERLAVAKGTVTMKPETLAMIKDGKMEKGDVLNTARLAGVTGAKQTSQLLPLCHPLPIDHISVDLELDEDHSAVQITVQVKAHARTGVEMEALVAVTAAALTVYDMCKAVDRGMRLEGIRLVRKEGGKSGPIVLE